MIARTEITVEFFTPEKVWFELHRDNDACDAIVRMEDGSVYTALFVTIPYLHRQMDLMFAVGQDTPDVPAVRYAGMETPHLVVEQLSSDIIEDAIDNLIALDMFECYFTRVTEHDDERTSNDGKLATQEVAAVVISDVLVVQE